MAYPMLESPIGDKFYYDGNIILKGSSAYEKLLVPTEETTYYETVRIKDDILLYLESHLERLQKSVKGIEDFPVDVKDLEERCYEFLHDNYKGTTDANLRIVLTKKHLLIHICEANIPAPELFEKGIDTSMLKWDRVDPNIKVFRGDYKKAVKDVFDKNGCYEVVLCDHEDKLYEGSKSNLFVVKGNKVYSAPDDKILLGITRKRVMDSLKKSDAELVIGTFTLDELTKDDGYALFVSSTPFDILPIRSVDGHVFGSAGDPMVRKIMDNYKQAINEYINNRR